MSERAIRLLLADVDGTLVTQAKVLTRRAVEAVQALHASGVLFAITSGRPPRGMAMLVEPLQLSTPISAFNGGLIVNPDMSVVAQKVVPEHLVDPTVHLMGSFGLATWIYRGAEWYVMNLEGPHTDREMATVQFSPTLVESFAGLTDNISKIVGVTDDREAIEQATVAVRSQFGAQVSAAQSQPYYLDVTHPEANKGAVAQYLADKYNLSTAEIATIGDMPNDVLMFAYSGLSIAMGNASSDVQRAARRVTTTNEEEGFATAVDRFVLSGL